MAGYNIRGFELTRRNHTRFTTRIDLSGRLQEFKDCDSGWEVVFESHTSVDLLS